jgi:Fe-S-cluster-containing dehydrogenase component
MTAVHKESSFNWNNPISYYGSWDRPVWNRPSTIAQQRCGGKCNFCIDRRAGLEPACVQTCPAGRASLAISTIRTAT